MEQKKGRIDMNIALLVTAIATNVGWAILSNYINKSLVEGYDEMKDVWIDIIKKQRDEIVVLKTMNKALKDQNEMLKQNKVVKIAKEVAGYEETE